MSYGYTPYQQGPPSGMPGAAPYPQQSSYPPGQAPFPSQNYHPSNSPYPPSNYPAYPPNQMPQPYNQMPMPGGGYPPANNPGYPPASGGYPPSNPPSSGGYPPSNPPSSGGYSSPPSSGGYPSSNPPYGGGHFPPGSCPPGPNPAMNPAGNPPPQGGMYGGPGGYPGQTQRPHSSPSPGHQEYMHRGHGSVYGNAPTGPAYGGHAPSRGYQKGTPTVFPADPFNPRADAETLRKAMKGFGTDEKAIIDVLANRTNGQRLDIAVQFKTLYGKDLIKDLKSELSGRFEDLVVAMMTPLPQFYAKEIHEALSGIGTDEDVLIEVFCTMTNNELRTIRAAYEGMYGRNLESDLSGDTSGTFRRLMVSLSTANRDESMMVDPGRVTQDAQDLLRAGELRLGTDESTFNAILCQRNYAHLSAVFQEYERITGHPIEKAIKNEFSGDAEDALLAVVRSVQDKPKFFAKRLRDSMRGMGTNDRQLIRLVVTRSEIDMQDIKQAYEREYGKSLEDAIKDDASGDYKRCLVALIS